MTIQAGFDARGPRRPFQGMGVSTINHATTRACTSANPAFRYIFPRRFTEFISRTIRCCADGDNAEEAPYRRQLSGARKENGCPFRQTERASIGIVSPGRGTAYLLRYSTFLYRRNSKIEFARLSLRAGLFEHSTDKRKHQPVNAPRLVGANRHAPHTGDTAALVYPGRILCIDGPDRTFCRAQAAPYAGSRRPGDNAGSGGLDRKSVV